MILKQIASHNPYLEQNVNKCKDKYQDLCKITTCTSSDMRG